MKRKLNRPLSEYTISDLWRSADHGLITERDVEREIERRMSLVAHRQNRTE